MAQHFFQQVFFPLQEFSGIKTLKETDSRHEAKVSKSAPSAKVSKYQRLTMKRIINVIMVSFLAIVVDSSTLPTNGNVISDSWQVTCEDAIGEADYYGMEVFGFGHRGTKIPVNLFDLKDHCPKVALAASRLHDYADTCLHPLPRLLVRPLIDSNDDHDICKGIKNETTSLNHVQVKILDLFKCFDDHVDYFRKCAFNFAHYINHVTRDENLKPNDKIQHVCKEFHVAYEVSSPN